MGQFWMEITALSGSDFDGIQHPDVNESCWMTTDKKRPASEEKTGLLDYSGLRQTDIWWSWGDLNPRPQALFGRIYMFSGLI